MWHKIRRWTRHAIKDEAGQSVFIMALAFVVLLVIIGLAIDLGLMYIERIQLGRACDAAALAGVQELPHEEYAARRAIQYLKENGYDPAEYELEVLGPTNAAALSWSAPANARGKITIDMETYEDSGLHGTAKDNSADKIRVHGTVSVKMNFMLLIGFRTVPVSGEAIAENIQNIDVIVVYDESGSMDDDNYCYSTNLDDSRSNQNQTLPCYVRTGEYPVGYRYYLPFQATYNRFCGAQVPVVDDGGYEMLVAEAEYYNGSTSYDDHNYHREYSRPGGTFWILQRTEDSYASGFRDSEDDHRGAHVMHMPHLWQSPDLIPGHLSASADSPKLDYVFTIPAGLATNTWHVWVRAQCGLHEGTATRADGCTVHWGANGNPIGSSSASDFPLYRISGDDYRQGGREDGSWGKRWTWVPLGSVQAGHALNDVELEINIWGGGMGFRFDKLLISRNPEGISGETDRAPNFIQDATPEWRDVDDRVYQTYSYSQGSQDWYGGPADTGGRGDYACNKCNPIYGQQNSTDDLDGNGQVDFYEICDNTQDDIFDDDQPMRAAKEAAKNFARRMRARHDQLGFVSYDTQYTQETLRELQCLVEPSRVAHGMPAGDGLWDPDTGPDNAWVWCFDHRNGPTGYDLEAERDPNNDHGSVIGAIEAMDASGSTNIGDGMREALETFSSAGGHYGRANAAKIMIVLTDGMANRWPGYRNCHGPGVCCAADHYDPPSQSNDEEKAADCVIYYTDMAAANGVIVYTIGLGAQVDGELLYEVAQKTGGQYYYAPTAQDLDRIFQQIADQIFMRLVG